MCSELYSAVYTLLLCYTFFVSRLACDTDLCYIFIVYVVLCCALGSSRLNSTVAELSGAAWLHTYTHTSTKVFLQDESPIQGHSMHLEGGESVCALWTPCSMKGRDQNDQPPCRRVSSPPLFKSRGFVFCQPTCCWRREC
jgi:hypothetical protein